MSKELNKKETYKKLLVLPLSWKNKNNRLSENHSSFSAYIRSLIYKDAKERKIRIKKDNVPSSGTYSRNGMYEKEE